MAIVPDVWTHIILLNYHYHTVIEVYDDYQWRIFDFLLEGGGGYTGIRITHIIPVHTPLKTTSAVDSAKLGIIYKDFSRTNRVRRSNVAYLYHIMRQRSQSGSSAASQSVGHLDNNNNNNYYVPLKNVPAGRQRPISPSHVPIYALRDYVYVVTYIQHVY